MHEAIDTVELFFGKRKKEWKVISDPIPHIAVKSKKELHGWYDSATSSLRDCTAERLLINPYNGCSHDCFFCYSNAFFGYFSLYFRKKVITVFENFDRVVRDQLDTLSVASCGYLSPVTDPFQPINKKYRLSEKIIEVFIEKNIPIEVVTKGIIPDRALNLLSEQEHSFAQVSILTEDEELRKKMVRGGAATTEQLFSNFRALLDRGIFTVARIDPIIPSLTDDSLKLNDLIATLKDIGVNHIVFSCMDIPFSLRSHIFSHIKKIDPNAVIDAKKLYTERIKNSFHANIDYRCTLFSKLHRLSKEHSISMALCMEFEKKENNTFSRLNNEFMTSINCEGANVPIYKKNSNSEKFRPINCLGNCLSCRGDLVCDISDLRHAKNWKLRDYKRWSREK